MQKKTKEFFLLLLKKLSQSIQTLHSSEVESVFKRFKKFIKELDAESSDVFDCVASFMLMLSSLGLLTVIVLLCMLVGGLI